jgi:hypothetical protein
MYIKFRNRDPHVDVKIRGLQIVRGYSMCCLDCDSNNHCTGGLCNGGGPCYAEENRAVHPDFAERKDYPCNYTKSGGMGFSAYHDNHYFQQIVNQKQPAGTILKPGTTYSWTWTNPDATFSAFSGSTNYVRAAHCLINFNNVWLCNDDGECDENLYASTDDVPIRISLDNVHWTTVYHSKNNHG